MAGTRLLRAQRHWLWRLWGSEGGITHAEVLATVVILGILTAITTSLWLSTIEDREVDSATNQLAADLRRAHNSATNRLASWQVVTDTATPNTYQVGPSGALLTRSLPDGTGTANAVTITFNADGSATLPGNAATTTVTVHDVDDGGPAAVINVNATTSRIQLVG